MKPIPSNPLEFSFYKKIFFYLCVATITTFLCQYIASFKITLYSAVPFLKYNAADVPLILLGFIFGPFFVAMNVLMISIVEILQNGSSSIIGVLMYYLSTIAMVLPSSMIYTKHKTTKSMVLGLAISCFVVTLTMVLWNLIFVPIYINTSFEEAKSLILPGIIPFNLTKTMFNSIITIILYPGVNLIAKKYRKLLVKFKL
ncbi:MAG: ECF transporter S component [Oscillospiraceae bacterium]